MLVLVPVPKSSKDSSVSSNYCPVAHCSSLSKGLKHLILESYGDHLHNSHLQFVCQGSVLSPLLFAEGYCTCLVCMSVYPSVPALAASASVETSKQRYSRVSLRLFLDLYV